jgi:hypothetical protein
LLAAARFEITADDLFVVICCDGIYDVLTDQQVSMAAQMVESAILVQSRHMANPCNPFGVSEIFSISWMEKKTSEHGFCSAQGCSWELWPTIIQHIKVRINSAKPAPNLTLNLAAARGVCHAAHGRPAEGGGRGYPQGV